MRQDNAIRTGQAAARGARKKRRRIFVCVIVCFALIAALYAASSDLVREADAWCQDTFHLIAGQRYPARHTVIVSLDDETLQAFPDTPLLFWNPLYAKAIERLKSYGASVIALDMHLGISAGRSLATIAAAPSCQQEFLALDQSFDLALSQGGIILAANLVRDKQGVRLHLPAMEYVEAISGNLDDVGITTMLRDPDNVVRTYKPAYVPTRTQDPEEFAALQPPSPWLTFAALAARRAGGNAAAFFPSKDALLNVYPIAFCGPPGSIPRISLATLLGDGTIPPETRNLLNGRAILIGAEFEGAGDRLPTPYSRLFPWFGYRDMSNVEIHANIVESILANGRLVGTSWVTTALIWSLFLGFTAWFCERFPPTRAALLTLMVLPVAWSMGLAFFLYGRLLPVAGLTIGLAVVNLGVNGQRLTSTERIRDQIRAALGQYVSDPVLEMVLSQDSPPNLGGEKRTVTVLYSDIRNFTTISERIQPEQVVEILNTYFTEVCEAVRRNGGMVDKFIGDAVMAIFGAPVDMPDQSCRAVATALEIRDIAKRFNNSPTFRKHNLMDLSFGIGIGLHRGPAVMGNIGSPGRMNYTATGDTVNVAQRVEGLTKIMGCVILASIDVVTEAGPGLSVGKSCTTEVKGRKGQVHVYEILGLDPQPEQGTCDTSSASS